MSVLRTLGLIPARGGSQGVPRKNVRLLGGRPLVAYTIEAALAARALASVVLSTEDAEIAAVAECAGARVPFRRPAALAADDTPMLPVVQHALRALEEAGERYDAVCLLQPTNPFRAPEDIDASIALLADSGADAVVSVRPVPDSFHPYWSYLQRPDGELVLAVAGAAPPARRQALPPAVHRDGSLYVVRRDVVLERGSLYGDRLLGYACRESAAAAYVNIDTPADWAEAERWLCTPGSA